MFPFDVVLFDVGGVLLTNGWGTCERTQVLDSFNLDKAEFEKRHPVPNDAWERDAISAEAYLEETVFYEPRSFSMDDFVAAICSVSVELPNGALGVLKEIAASGKTMVGCLNNEARLPNEYRFRQFGLRNYFEVALSSCYLGLRKPKVAIYQRALDILGRPAKRVLFIDARPENVAGAAKVGMKGIQFKGADALRQDLETIGVL